MSLLFFLKSHPDFDVAYAPSPAPDVDAKKKRRTFKVKKSRRTIALEEINTRASDDAAIQEIVRMESMRRIEDRKKRHTAHVVSIMRILDYLDEVDG